jgi:cell division protease FtsH
LMFFDEVDAFGDRSRWDRHGSNSYHVQVVNAFIAQLDGAAGRQGLIYLGASNDVSRCDPAILRAGRLNRIIRIGLPSARQIEGMLRVRLKGRLEHEDLGEIALLACGCTGADIERITNDAARVARGEGRPMRLADLRRAVAGADEDRNSEELARTAVHEAGHLIVDLVLFDRPEDLYASVASSRTATGVTVRAKLPQFAGTREDYHRRLQIVLAGRAAEEAVFGAGRMAHGAGGLRNSDLQRGTAIAVAMVASLGLAGPSPLLYLGARDETEELLLFPEVRAAANAELAAAYGACCAVLSRHRAALDEVSATLARNGRMRGEEAAAILAANPPESPT